MYAQDQPKHSAYGGHAIHDFALGGGFFMAPPNQHKNTTGENLQELSQVFGVVLGAATLVFAFKAIPAFFVPLEKRSKGVLVFGLAWIASLGVAPLCFLVPDLFPWQPWQLPYGTIHAIEVVFMIWPFLLFGIWKSAAEIYRRKKATTA